MDPAENNSMIERCDIFDFMATYIGLSVLHPGGLNATDTLLAQLDISTDSRILDIACGKGTTGIHIAKKYGCRVTGIDISEELIAHGKEQVLKEGVGELVTLEVGDALTLPFNAGEFDYTLSQAVLILIPDKLKAINEAVRVVKPGGKAGWIELSWKKNPSEELLTDMAKIISESWMSNIETFENWEKIFRKADITKFMVFKSSMEFQGMKGMIYDDGFLNSLKIMSKFLINSDTRERIGALNDFFSRYHDFFGYGIYILTR